MEKLTRKGTRFVNESGKEVILHGLNVLQRQRRTTTSIRDLRKLSATSGVPASTCCASASSGTARSRSRGRWIWSISGK